MFAVVVLLNVIEGNCCVVEILVTEFLLRHAVSESISLAVAQYASSFLTNA